MSKYIDNINELDLSKTYRYADYLLWRFKERVELFKGKVFEMSPAPSMSHQLTLNEINDIVRNYFKNKDCNVFFAPFDVELFLGEKSKSSVVQPDLCVICDKSKLVERGCHGAPDLIVEVLSKENSKKEIQNKYDLYEEAGVREYWIVDYMRRTVLIQALNENGIFEPQRLRAEGDQITSSIFPNLTFQVEDLFKGVTDSLNESEEEYLTKKAVNRL
jgi:Uma2 family endonuclease